MTTAAPTRGQERAQKGFLRTIVGFCALGLLLAYAGFAGYLHFGLWLPKEKPSLFSSKENAAQIEQRLKALSPEGRATLLKQQQGALRSNPLDVSILKNLILLAAIEGDQPRVDALVSDAAKRSLRDLPLQGLAAQAAINQQNYSDAFYRIDALIRSKPDFAQGFFTTMMGLIEKPKALDALADLLAQSPPWRPGFLAQLNARGTAPDSAYRLYSTMRKKGAVIANDELRTLLQRFITDKAFDKASFIWLDFLTDAELRKVGTVFDGGFDLPFGNRFFDWTAQKIKNAEARIVPRATGSADRVLTLEFAPGRTAFDHFGQYLRLAPGRYGFTGEQKADNLENPRGMVWVISCAGANTTTLVETVPLLGTVPWEPFSTAFEVPAENCPTQRLRLKLNATAALDQQVSGRVFYDELKIVSPSK